MSYRVAARPSARRRLSDGTPFGDVAWVAHQLRDYTPASADLTVPLYSGAVLDIDSSAATIGNERFPVTPCLTADTPESVKAFYGIPAKEHFPKISPDERHHRVFVTVYRTRDPQ